MTERFDEFTTLITNIYRSIKKIRNDEMAEYDLKSMHLSCLHYIYKYKSLTAAQLCDFSLEDKANISRCLRFLEEEGYIAPKSDERKRYQCLYILTERGSHVARSIEDKIANILKLTGEALSDGDRAIMYSSLRKISNNLTEICDNYND